MKDVEMQSLYRESLLHADSEITVRGWVRTNQRLQQIRIHRAE